MSKKLLKCLDILKDKINDADIPIQIITIIKSLDLDIEYAEKYLKDSTKYSPDDVKRLWIKARPNSRWNWNSLLDIVKHNTDPLTFEKIKDQYFYSEEKLLLSGEQGIAKLFANIMREKLVIHNKQGDGFLFNENTRTYDKKLKCELVDMIPDILGSVVDECINKLKEEYEDDEDTFFNKKKSLSSIKTIIQSYRGCQNIYKAVIPKLLNKEFKLPADTTSCVFKKNIAIKTEEDYTQTILRFLKDKCAELAEGEYREDFKVQPQLLYDTYKDYCKEQDVAHTDIKKFGAFIATKFGKKKQIRVNGDRVKYYFGIKIL